MNSAGKPLGDVVQQLRDSAGIPIQLDQKALDDAGIAPDTDTRRCRVKRYSARKWREAEFL